jgi:uncharacterized protein
MKKAAFLLILLLPLISAQLPHYTDKYVDDFAGIFSAQEKTELRSILSDAEANTTSEVVVVTVNTTAPYAPSEYRTRLFNEWGVGKADVDNGLLILYAVAEHRIEVEVGYGLEGVLPDSKVGRMLDDYYVPLRDANQTTTGIIEFTKAVAALLNENRDEILSHKSGYSMPSLTEFLAWFIIPIIIGIIFIVFVIIAVNKNKRRKGKKGRFSGWWFGGGLGGGRFGGGGGGGFGGGGFGGGGSGGGGAGR